MTWVIFNSDEIISRVLLRLSALIADDSFLHNFIEIAGFFFLFLLLGCSSSNILHRRLEVKFVVLFLMQSLINIGLFISENKICNKSSLIWNRTLAGPPLILNDFFIFSNNWTLDPALFTLALIITSCTERGSLTHFIARNYRCDTFSKGAYLMCFSSCLRNNFLKIIDEEALFVRGFIALI